MPFTASLDGNGPSFPFFLPSPGDGDSNDPSHSTPSFAFVIYQLSVLLSSLGSTACDTFACQQLLAALSNVLYTSIHLRQLPIIISSQCTAVSAAPAPPVTSPITEPPRPTNLSPPDSHQPSSPVPPVFTVRVLSPVEPLTAPVTPRRNRRSRKRRRVRSCPSSPVLASNPSPPESISTITTIITPSTTNINPVITSPNPFALLADVEDDTVEQINSDDKLAHKTRIHNASSSPVNEPAPIAQPSSDATIPTPAPIPTPIPTIDSVTSPTAPTVQDPALATAAKRRTRPNTPPTPDHRFFQRLTLCSLELRSHFEKHYALTSSICPCTMFPVYSSKLRSNVSLPPELDHLCLVCLVSLFSSLGDEMFSILYRWVPSASEEMTRFYMGIYAVSEIDATIAAIPENEMEANCARNERCIIQLLDRLGVSTAPE